jgi:hypothetical protein
MKINPENVLWTAPTKRTDGSAITTPLNYEIGHRVGGNLVPIAIIVGSLQTNGVYKAPLADFSFGDGPHEIALRATESGTKLTSAWSDTVTFEIVSAGPQPPLALAVE